MTDLCGQVADGRDGIGSSKGTMAYLLFACLPACCCCCCCYCFHSLHLLNLPHYNSWHCDVSRRLFSYICSASNVINCHWQSVLRPFHLAARTPSIKKRKRLQINPATKLERNKNRSQKKVRKRNFVEILHLFKRT